MIQTMPQTLPHNVTLAKVLFLLEDRDFLLTSAVISARCSIGSNNAVTRDRGIVIFVQNISNRAIRVWASGTFRNLRIGQRCPFGNLARDIKNALRKRSRARCHTVKKLHDEQDRREHNAIDPKRRKGMFCDKCQ